jgi:hypothetical protein
VLLKVPLTFHTGASFTRARAWRPRGPRPKVCAVGEGRQKCAYGSKTARPSAANGSAGFLRASRVPPLRSDAVLNDWEKCAALPSASGCLPCTLFPFNPARKSNGICLRRSHRHRQAGVRCYDHNFLRFSSKKKLAIFLQTNVMIIFLHTLALFWVKKRQIFCHFFRRKYLKIITSVPGRKPVF